LARSRNAARKFFRILEYIENIRVFDVSDFLSIAAKDAHARRARD
jgi:hypothetical protein